MKKIISVFLALLLIFSATACGPLGGDGEITPGIIFGDVTPNPEPNAEGITHDDPEIAAFIEQKVVFLNKVLPDSSLYTSEDGSVTDEAYRSIAVFIEVNHPFTDYARDEEWYVEINAYCQSIISEKLPAMGITAPTATVKGGRIMITYPSYESFEEKAIRALATDIFGIIDRVYILARGGYNSGENKFSSEHTLHSEIARLTDLSDAQRDYLREVIEGGSEELSDSESCDSLPSLIKNLADHGELSAHFPELAESNICRDRYCSVGIGGAAILVKESEIFGDAEGDYYYLVLRLAKRTSGVYLSDIDVKGAKLNGSRLTVAVSCPSGLHDSLSHCPTLIFKLSHALVEEGIGEIETRLVDNHGIYD